MTDRSEIGYYQDHEFRNRIIWDSEKLGEIDVETHELYLAILKEPEFFSNDRLREINEVAHATTLRLNQLIEQGKCTTEQVQFVYQKHSNIYNQSLLQLANMNNENLGIQGQEV